MFSLTFLMAMKNLCKSDIHYTPRMFFFVGNACLGVNQERVKKVFLSGDCQEEAFIQVILIK